MSMFFFRFCRKVAHTKTQQITEKESEQNGPIEISHVSIGGVNFVFYPLYYLHFLPCYLHQLPFLPPPSPPPPPEYAAPPVRSGIRNCDTTSPLTSEKDLVTSNPLHQSPRFRRCICQCACCHLWQRTPFPPTWANFFSSQLMVTANSGLSDVAFVNLFWPIFSAPYFSTRLTPIIPAAWVVPLSLPTCCHTIQQWKLCGFGRIIGGRSVGL